MKKRLWQTSVTGLFFSLLIMVVFTQQASANTLNFTEYGDFSTYKSKIYEDDVVYAYKGTSLVKTDIYGQVLWEITSNQGNFTGNIGLYGDYLSIGTDKGVAYFFNPNNGKVKQFFTVPTNGSSVTGAYIDLKGQIHALSGSYIYVLRPNGTFIAKSKSFTNSIVEMNTEYIILGGSPGYGGTYYWVNTTDLSEISSKYISNLQSIDKQHNKMYVSSGTTLTAYQLNNGRELWSKEFGGGNAINSATVGPDGAVYVGMASGNFYAMDPVTRDIKWQFNEGTPNWGQAVVDIQGNVYVGQSNTSVNQFYIFKFSKTGEVLEMSSILNSAHWLNIRKDGSLYYTNEANLYSSKEVTVSDKNIPKDDVDKSPENPETPELLELKVKKYGQFGTYSNYHYTADAVYAYDEKGLVKTNISGEIVWEVNNKNGRFTGQINLFNDYLSVGTENGSVLFVNPVTGKVIETYAIPSNGSSVTAAYKGKNNNIYAVSGSYVYEVRTDGSLVQKSKSYTSTILSLNPEYVILSGSSDYSGTVYWVNPDDLTQISSGYLPIVKSLDNKNNKMYVASGMTLKAYQLNNGRELWEKQFAGGSSINAVSAGPDGTIYVGMESGNFYAMDPISRDIKWQFNEGTPSWGQAVVDSKGNVFVGQSNGTVNQHYIFKFDALGKKLGIAQIPASANSLRIRKDDSLYFINDRNYYSSEIIQNETPVKPPVGDGFTEWEHKKNTSSDKMWDVTYNLAIDVKTIHEKNIYVTDATGNVTPMLYVIDRSRSDSKVSIIPVKDYKKGETYTLWIKDIKAEGGKLQKENIKMSFTIAK